MCSRNPTYWGTSNNYLTPLWMLQLGNESQLTSSARRQIHLAELIAAVRKQNLTVKEKLAQIDLIDSVALISLLTGIEPIIAKILYVRKYRDRSFRPPKTITVSPT